MTRKKRQVLAKPYEPTPAEAKLVEAYHNRPDTGHSGTLLKFDLDHGLMADHLDEGVGAVRLMADMGTTDHAFYGTIIQGLARIAAPSREGSLVEQRARLVDKANGALAIVRAIAPRDGTETLLAVQMAAIHDATLTATARLRAADTVQAIDSHNTALNKLVRTFTTQVEALKRYRSQGVQKVIVQHVHVNEGGQAIVAGEMQGGGGSKEKEHQPHGRDDMRFPERQAMLGTVEALGMPVPGTREEGLDRVQVPRGGRRGALRAV